MESSSIVPVQPVIPTNVLPPKSASELVIETSLSSTAKSDSSSVVDLTGLSQTGALKIEADEIIKRLNELLADDLPDGIGSLDPKQFTPEATADRIVSQITSLFPAFREQRPDLSDEEALEQFMELATKGVDQGYSEAFDILEGLGAFKIDGIEESISQTKNLISEKLAAFENMMRESFDAPEPEEQAQAGAQYTLEQSISNGISIAPTAEENLQTEKVEGGVS